MAVAPLIIAGVGAGISAYGQWKAGKQAKKAGQAAQAASNDQAELLDYNAHVADLQAQDAVDRGTQEESRFRQGVKLMVGSQRTGIAASGVDVGYGSAVDVQADAAYLGELDALTLRTNAAREAWGYKVQAFNTRRQAMITRKEGVQQAATGAAQQTAARIGAVGGAVLTGGSLLAQRYGMGDNSKS